jgi:hypothetical protein
VKIGQEVEISVGEPWDVGIIKSHLIDEKDGILMFYSDPPITIGKVQTQRFYGTPRHTPNMGVYNFAYIPNVEDYTIDDIAEYEKDWSNVKWLMTGSVK